MRRREVLQGDQIDFVNGDQEGEVKRGEESNLVEIVFKQLVDKYADQLLVLREAKKMFKQSKYIGSDLIAQASQSYNQCKSTEKG